MLTAVIALILLMLSGFTEPQRAIKWVGKSGSDPDRPENWQMIGSNAHPEYVRDEHGFIGYSLLVKDETLDLSVFGQLRFSNSNMGLKLDGAYAKAIGLTNGNTELSNAATIELTSTQPLKQHASIQIADSRSWVKLTRINPNESEKYLSSFSVEKGKKATSKNIRINQYYFVGSLIRSLHDESYTPLCIYKGPNDKGNAFDISEFDIYRGHDLEDFDDTSISLRLDRGYMVTLAENEDGTGASQVYIADESDLAIDLPEKLHKTVSFIRVMPWNWVTKKGVASFRNGIGASWTYNWGYKDESLPNLEYTPMAWSGRSATLKDVASHIQKKGVTHFMGFNESDNCDDQSGQYDNLCQIEVAVPLYENLMGTGLRLVSPSPREEGPFGWLDKFMQKADSMDVRVDVMGIHWYDWGSKPKNTPYEDPQLVFERFKNYLERVHDRYQRPIWLTEFNANPNRDSSVHIGFVKLAIPYLEQLDYVERYCYFEPFKERSLENNVNPTSYRDEDGNLTPFGKVYVNLGVPIKGQ